MNFQQEEFGCWGKSHLIKANVLCQNSPEEECWKYEARISNFDPLWEFLQFRMKGI